MSTEGSRNYSDEEIEAIFRSALETQAAETDGFSHDELIAAAREVGLDDAAVERAVAEVESERSEGAIRERLRTKQREDWLRHFVTYLVVAGGSLLMHALGYTGAWAIMMAFFWGMGVALHAFRALRGPTEADVEKEKRHLNRKARRAQRARARAEAKRRKAEEHARRRQHRHQKSEAADQLERVIEEGVTLLLATAAKKLREATEQMEPRPSDTEFGEFVRRKKAEQRGPRTAAPRPEDARPRPQPSQRARVEIDEEEEAEAEVRDRHRRRSGR